MTAHSYRDTLSTTGTAAVSVDAVSRRVQRQPVQDRRLDARRARGRARRTRGRQLSLVGVVFILPFLLFSGYAGQLADVYSKRTRARRHASRSRSSRRRWACSRSWPATCSSPTPCSSCIALQATFFSPAKYGILPEILPDRDLSRANGLLEMSTFVAIVARHGDRQLLFDALERSAVDRRSRSSSRSPSSAPR